MIFIFPLSRHYHIIITLLSPLYLRCYKNVIIKFTSPHHRYKADPLEWLASNWQGAAIGSLIARRPCKCRLCSCRVGGVWGVVVVWVGCGVCGVLLCRCGGCGVCLCVGCGVWLCVGCVGCVVRVYVGCGVPAWGVRCVECACVCVWGVSVWGVCVWCVSFPSFFSFLLLFEVSNFSCTSLFVFSSMLIR